MVVDHSSDYPTFEGFFCCTNTVERDLTILAMSMRELLLAQNENASDARD